MEVEAGGRYFRRHITILKFGGINLTGEESFPYRVYATSVLFLVYTYTILGLSVFFGNGVQGSFQMIKFEIGFIISSIKSITVFLNRQKLGNILLKLEKKPFVAKLERGGTFEAEAIQKFESTNNFQTKLYWATAFIYITFTHLYAVGKRTRSSNHENWAQPYVTLFVGNLTRSPDYELTIAYQAFGVWWLTFYFTTIDLLIGGVLCNVTYQLKLLQNYIRQIETQYSDYSNVCEYLNTADKAIVFIIIFILQTYCSTSNLHSNIIKDNRVDTNWSPVNDRIKGVVEYHTQIITFVKELDDIFSILLLPVFLNTFAFIGTMLYQISLTSTAGLSLIRVLTEVLIGIFQVFITCYWAAQVRDESENVAKAVYDVIVTIPNQEFQQAMKLIMLRGQTPITITAGKFVDIDLTTFAWILRMSYSAFMILRKSQQK